MLAELVAFALIGVIFTVIAVIFGAVKKSLTGTNLTKEQQNELEKFKKTHAQDND